MSIWGRTVAEYAEAAALVAGGLTGDDTVVAVEVNVSCPNVEDRSRMFSHSPDSTKEVLEATECGLPRWAKLSPNVPDITEIAAAALEGGADGLTLVNTLLGLALDLESGRPVLGGGGGGLSGEAVHPVAVRAVWECRAAFPDAPIVGVGGIRTGSDAAEFLLAGADAVEVGTGNFARPEGTVEDQPGPRALVHLASHHGCRNEGQRPRPHACMKEDTMKANRASFGTRVSEAVSRLGPLCAGIDPSSALLAQWGLRDDPAGLRGSARSASRHSPRSSRSSSPRSRSSSASVRRAWPRSNDSSPRRATPG